MDAKDGQNEPFAHASAALLRAPGCAARSPGQQGYCVAVLLLTPVAADLSRCFDARDRSNGVTDGERQSMARRTNGVVVWLDEQDDPLTILCECGGLECRESLSVSRDVYDRVRGHSSTFLVASGHEDGAEILEQCGNYVVVENVGAPAAPEPGYTWLLSAPPASPPGSSSLRVGGTPLRVRR
jgi:hypothetical protein